MSDSNSTISEHGLDNGQFDAAADTPEANVKMNSQNGLTVIKREVERPKMRIVDLFIPCFYYIRPGITSELALDGLGIKCSVYFDYPVGPYHSPCHWIIESIGEELNLSTLRSSDANDWEDELEDLVKEGNASSEEFSTIDEAAEDCVTFVAWIHGLTLDELMSRVSQTADGSRWILSTNLE